MNIHEEIEQLFTIYKDTRAVVNKIRLFPLLLETLITQTNFLSKNCDIKQRIFHVRNKIPTTASCKTCGTPTKFFSLSKGYSAHCSTKCSKINPDVQKKYEQTCLEKFGTTNATKAAEILNKIKESYFQKSPQEQQEIQERRKRTNLEKHGAEYSSQNKEIAKKISVANYRIYHEKSPEQLKDIQNKREQACVERFGTKSPFENEEVKEMIKHTIKEK